MATKFPRKLLLWVEPGTHPGTKTQASKRKESNGVSARWCLTCRVERGVMGVRWSLVKGGGGAIRLCRHTHALVVAFEKTFKITFFFVAYNPRVTPRNYGSSSKKKIERKVKSYSLCRNDLQQGDLSLHLMHLNHPVRTDWGIHCMLFLHRCILLNINCSLATYMTLWFYFRQYR